MKDFVPLLTSSAGVKWSVMDSEDGKQHHFLAQQDVEPILEANKAAQNHNAGWSEDKTFRRVASIPIGVQFEWLTKYGVDCYSQDPEMKRKVFALLDSNEYMYLRTAHFRLGDAWRKSI